MLSIKKGALIISSDGASEGAATGGGYHCRLEGCMGWRIGVRWNDGDLTFPCSKGMYLKSKDGIITAGRIIE